MADPFECKKWSVKSHALTCPATTFTAGRGLRGGKQIRRLPNNYWRGPVVLNSIRQADMVDYRGWLASLNGSSEAFDLPICDPHALKGEGKTDEQWIKLLGYNLADLCGPIAGVYGLPFDDGMCFSDGTGFLVPPFVQGETVAASPAGSNTLELNGAADFLRRGNYFSTADNYLHVLTKSPDNRTIEFNPPLRRAVSSGEAIETQNPTIKVRLMTDTTGTATQNYGRYTNEISLDVEEVLTR